MSRKQNLVIENQTLLENMKKIQKASGLRQCDFFKTYLKDLPGAPTANTDATADGDLSQITTGLRPVPVSFLPVYAHLGQISIDRLLTGQDWTPEARPVTYGDVLQLLSDLLRKEAAEIQPGGAGISLKDPALVAMLAALGDLDRLQRDGFLSANWSDATLAGLRQREELQAPVFDASSAPAATLRRITAEAIQENTENAQDKMLRLIRCISK